MARPEAKVDSEQVEKLAAIMCSYEEMASVLDCSVSTLQRRFEQAIKRGRDRGRMSLKRKQYEVAMAGNVTMLIWMGKQHLGQKDKMVDETPQRAPIDDLLNWVMDLQKIKTAP